MSRRSRLGSAIAAGVGVCCLATGCVSQDVADAVNQRVNFGMSTSELATANRVAFQRARQEGAKVTARATVSGSDPESSAGTAPAPCTTGRLLHVTMVGQFPHAPSAGGEKARVRGQELTVDAATGRVCDARYVTAAIVVDPTSVVLFSR